MKVLTPRGGGSGICHMCDRAFVHDGRKCHICGSRHGQYRLKVCARNQKMENDDEV